MGPLMLFFVSIIICQLRASNPSFHSPFNTFLLKLFLLGKVYIEGSEEDKEQKSTWTIQALEVRTSLCLGLRAQRDDVITEMDE